MGLLITFFIALASFAGIVFIVWRKIPLLRELPEDGESVGEFATNSAKTIVSSQRLRDVASKNFDRTMGKARQFASKTEFQTGEVLNRFRKQSQERKGDFEQSYWDQLRKNSKSSKRPKK